MKVPVFNAARAVTNHFINTREVANHFNIVLDLCSGWVDILVAASLAELILATESCVACLVKQSYMVGGCAMTCHIGAEGLHWSFCASLLPREHFIVK